MPIVIYYSDKCSNCVRLLNNVRRIPSLQNARLVYIERTGAVRGIDAVPTLVDERGQRHIGGKAFEFLKRYEDETIIEPVQLGTGGLSYGSIENGGELSYTTNYFDF